MSEPQPEYVWAYPPGRRRNVGRIWLIVGLSVVALVLAVGAFWLVVRPGWVPSEATPTPTADATPTLTPSPDASPTARPSATPEPEPTVVSTPPPAPDPDLAVFRDRVSPVLDAAATGLRYAREEGGSAAMQDIVLLQDDAARLAQYAAPRSLAAQWADGVSTYQQTLERLRTGYEQGTDTSSADAAAQAALNDLNALVGR